MHLLVEPRGLTLCFIDEGVDDEVHENREGFRLSMK